MHPYSKTDESYNNPLMSARRQHGLADAERSLASCKNITHLHKVAIISTLLAVQDAELSPLTAAMSDISFRRISLVFSPLIG